MPTLFRSGFETYFEVRGTGEPLLLICGLSADLQIWRRVMPFLEQRFCTIAFDNRGAGRSSAPDEPYSIAQMADDAVAVLDHLQIDTARVVGWSMGGVIAQSLAVKHPRRVRHLLLLSSLLGPDPMFRNAVNNWVNMRRSSMTVEQVARHVAWLVLSRAFAANDTAYEATIQFMVNNPYAQPLHGLIRQADALLAHAPLSGLAELPMPVSIVVGVEDRLTPVYLSEQLMSAIPHSQLRALPGGHLGASEYPEQYVAAMTELLSSPTDGA